MPEPTLVMATSRPRRSADQEAEPVLISVEPDGYVEFVLDDGHSLTFDATELTAAISGSSQHLRDAA